VKNFLPSLKTTMFDKAFLDNDKKVNTPKVHVVSKNSMTKSLSEAVKEEKTPVLSKEQTILPAVSSDEQDSESENGKIYPTQQSALKGLKK
jgi:hypothetical protein